MSNLKGFDQDDLTFPYWDDKADELLNEDLDDEGFDEFVQLGTKKDKNFLDTIEEEEDEDE